MTTPLDKPAIEQFLSSMAVPGAEELAFYQDTLHYVRGCLLRTRTPDHMRRMAMDYLRRVRKVAVAAVQEQVTS